MRVWVDVCVGVTLLVAVAESDALLLADDCVDAETVDTALAEGCVEADRVSAEVLVDQPVVLAVVVIVVLTDELADTD